jgi:hypothetical protein
MLLCNGAVNTPKHYETIEDGVFRGVRAKLLQSRIQLSSIEWRTEFRDASLPRYDIGSSGNELSRVFRIDGYIIVAGKELGW